MQRFLLVLISLTSVLFLCFSCTKDKIDIDEDRMLFEGVMASGFQYYQNGNKLPGVAPSPHGNFRLRFNEIAAAVLDSSGELPGGTEFPQGSIIVKEVYSGNNLDVYAVIKKESSNAVAAKGWIWAELNPDGTTHYSAGNKGQGCTGCHSGAPNRDFTRTFDLH